MGLVCLVSLGNALSFNEPNCFLQSPVEVGKRLLAVTYGDGIQFKGGHTRAFLDASCLFS